MKRAKIFQLVIIIAMIIAFIISASTHYKLVELAKNNLINSSEMMHSMHHYLGQQKLFEQSKDEQIADIQFIRSGLIIFERYMSNVIQPYDEASSMFWDEETEKVYNMLLDSVENKNEEKYEMARDLMRKIYVQILERHDKIKKMKFINIPILGEYLVKKELNDMITQLQSK